MNNIEICEHPIRHGRKTGKIAILRGGLNSENPTALMNNAVHKYVGSKGYNEFVEIHLDNPWVRVIIGGINDFEYIPFDKQKL